MPFIVGCNAFGPTDAQARAMQLAYDSYIKQARNAEMIYIAGSDTKPAEFTMKGSVIRLSAPVSPLSAMGNDGTREKALDVAESLGRTTGVVLGLDKLPLGEGSSTVNNYGVAP